MLYSIKGEDINNITIVFDYICIRKKKLHESIPCFLSLVIINHYIYRTKWRMDAGMKTKTTFAERA